MSNSRPSAGAWAAAIGWAALPLLSCGLATPFSIGFAAFWLRSKYLAAAAGAYGVCILAFFIVAGSYEDVSNAPDQLWVPVSIGLVLSWIGGLVNSAILVPKMVNARRKQPLYLHQQPQRRPGEPEWIGHYRVIRSIGRGGQGTVYLATAPNGAPVAVKVLHDLGDEAARRRFAREVDATRRVATFSTARVLDVNISGEHAYIISEYVEGPSLEQLVRSYGPRDEDGLTRLALSTAGALAAIHRAGVVHRDFKPGNVLIGADGPRVIDFGIARALDHTTMTNKMAGTPPYMSPEQLSGLPIGPPSDVFSWAVTMVFAATGRPAFGEDTVPAVFNRVLTQHPDLSRIPPSLRGIVGACLDKRPEHRPTAADVMLAIVH